MTETNKTSLWQRWITPKATDPDAAFRERTIRAMVVFQAGLMLVILLTTVLIPIPSLLQWIASPVTILILVCIAGVTVSQGWLKLAEFIQIFLNLVALSFVAAAYGYWSSATVYAMLVIIPITGIILPRRLALGTIVMMNLVYLGIAFWQSDHGITASTMPPSPLTLSPMGAVVLLTTAFAFLIALGAYLFSEFDTRLITSNNLAAELKHLVAQRTADLEASEANYRALVQQAGDVVYLTDTTGHFVYVNPQAEKLTGYSSDKIVGTHFTSLIRKDWQARTASFYRRQNRKDLRETTYEFPIITYSGEERWVEQRVILLHDENGAVGFEATVRDITERKGMEEKLRRQAIELQLLHQIRSRLANLTQQGEIIKASIDSIRESFGYALASLYLSDAGSEALLLQYQVGYDEVIPRIPKDSGVIGRTFRSGQPTLIADTRTEPEFLEAIPGIISEICVPLRRGDNTTFGILNIESQSVAFDEDDLSVMFALAEYISSSLELARSQSELKSSEERFRVVLESAPDGVVITDGEGHIEIVNGQTEQLFGYQRQDLIGQPFKMLIPAGLDLPPLAENEGVLDSFRASERGVHLDIMATRKNGNSFPAEVSLNPIPSRDGRLVFASIRDVTERKHAQEELQRQHEHLTALHETTLGLMNRLDVDDVLRGIVEQAARLVGTTHGFVEMVDPSGTCLEIQVATGVLEPFHGARLTRGEGLSGKVWDSGEPLIVEDYEMWSGRSAQFEAARWHSIVCVPMKSSGEVIGTIGLTFEESGRVFETEVVDILSRFAALAAIAYENATLYASAQREIAERKAAEETLSRQRLDLHQVINSMPNMLLRVNQERLLTALFAPRGFARIISTTDLDQPIEAILPPIMGHEISRFLTGNRTTGERGSLECTLDVAGEGHDFEIVLAPVHESTDTLVIIHDVTSRRQAERAAEKQRMLAEALADTAAILNSTLDQDVVLERILSNVESVVPIDGANVVLIEDGIGRVVRARGYSEELLPHIMGYSSSVQELPAWKQMIALEEPIAIQDTAASPEWVSIHPIFDPYRSYAGSPISVGGEVIGFLNLDSQTPGFYNETHAYRLKAFAAQAGVALQNARLYQQSQEQAEHLSLLNEIAQAASINFEPQALLQTLVELAPRIVGGDHCYITQWDPETQQVIPQTASRLMSQQYTALAPPPDEKTLTASAIAAGHSLMVEDVFDTPYLSRRIADQFPTRAMLTIPLRVAGRDLGALLLGYTEQHRCTEAEIRWAEQAADVIALAIDRAEGYLKLQQEHDFARQIMEVMGQGLVVIDSVGRIEYANPTFSQIIGYESETNIIGQDQDDMLLPEDREPVAQAWERRKRGISETYELLLVRQDGTTVPVMITASPRMEEGRVTGSISVVSDLTERKRAEEELQAQRDFFKALTDTMGQGLIVTDHETRFDFVNPAFASLLGYRPEELIGKLALDTVILPEDRPQMEAMRQRRRTGLTENYEVSYQRKDGGEVSMLITGVPRREGGQITGTIAVATDLTERKKAETELQAQRDFAQNIIDGMGQGLVLVHGEDRVIEFANDIAAKMLGYTPEEMIGRSTLEFVMSPEELISEDRMTRRLQGSSETYELELKYRDGSVRNVLISASPRWENRQIVGSILVLADLTERRKMEDTLRRQTAYLEGLYETSLLVLEQRDVSEKMQGLLERAARLVGAEYGFLDIVTPEGDAIEVWQGTGFYQPFVGRRMLPGEGVGGFVWKTGEAIFVPDYSVWEGRGRKYEAVTRAMIGTPLKSEGQVIGVIGVGTQNEQTSFTEENLDILKRFAALASIAYVNAQLLDAERDQRAYAEALRDSARILNSTLEFDQVLAHILDSVKRVVPHDTADVMLLENGEAKLVRASGYAELGLSNAEILGVTFPISETYTYLYMIENDEPIVISDTSTEPRWVDRGHFWVRSYAGAPIRIEGKVIGFLTLGSVQPGFFKPSHGERLSAFVNQAALAIQNARSYEQVQQMAILEERQRLARDLHDVVSQILFSAKILAEMLPKIWERNPDEGRARTEELHGLTRGALAEMRMLLIELRPSALEDSRLEDLLLQLRESIAAHTHAEIVLTVPPISPLPPKVKETFYRVAQEALNNIKKHAQATRIEIAMDSEPGRARLTVRDDGRGFDRDRIPPGHFGVGIMGERAEAVGASLDIRSEEGRGTEITLEWAEAEMKSMLAN